MALPTIVVVADAFKVLQDVAFEDRTVNGSSKLFDLIKETEAKVAQFDTAYSTLPVNLGRYFNQVGNYDQDLTDLTIGDLTDATLVAMLAATGEVGIVFGAVETPAGSRFRVSGTGDSTDNGLQGAKGSAVVANDVFEVYATSLLRFMGNFPTNT